MAESELAWRPRRRQETTFTEQAGGVAVEVLISGAAATTRLRRQLVREAERLVQRYPQLAEFAMAITARSTADGSAEYWVSISATLGAHRITAKNPRAAARINAALIGAFATADQALDRAQAAPGGARAGGGS